MMFLIFLVFIGLVGVLSTKVIVKIFPFNRVESFFYGVILAFIVFGLFGSFFVSWFKYDFWLMWLSIILSTILFVLADKLIKTPSLKNEQKNTIINAKDWPRIVWVIFYLAMISGIVSTILLAKGEKIFSPWEVLPWWFIISVFAGFIFILWSIVEKINFKKVFYSIIVLSFLIHSYLLVYQNGFGGDRFRHLGSENRLLQKLDYQPTLLTKDLWTTNIGSLKIPQALVDQAKTSYGFQWSIEVFISQLTGVEVFQINKFLLPIIWSLIFTFLSYLIGLFVFSDKSKALISAIIGNGFYLLQYYGAQGLPASYGVIVVLAIIPIWLSYLKTGDKKILLLASVFTILSYFNYSLSFLVLVFFGFLSLALRKKRSLGIIVTIIIPLFVFGLEIFGGNYFDFFLNKLKNAWSAGNLLYFNSLSRFFWINGDLLEKIDILFIFIFIFVSIFAFRQCWVKKDPSRLTLCLMFYSLILAYFFSWILLSGEHFLARRLTLFSSVFFIFILVEPIYDLIMIKKSQLAVIGLALFFTINFYSGPVLKLNISNRDWKKAEAIWKDISQLNNYPCIEDDLEVILALEAISAKRFQEVINNDNCNKYIIK